jgi:TolB-like protein/Flp pilus assembly protein TadD/predicted Ser/Thr protein kinase
MIGKTISHFKILEKLGEGGMGVVYLAEDTKLARRIALKLLPAEWTRNSQARARFLHEAQTAAALNHPNICTIYEVDEADDLVFLAMEHIEGESLRDKIGRGPMKIADVICTSLDVGQGLAAAHAQGIVHRDIKPGNVMLTSDGRAKVLDFGLALAPERTRLTMEGRTTGTVSYMSPEQSRGDSVDHRTDLWSLGVMIYEMLTGQRPFAGEHEQAVIRAIMNDEPEPPTGLRTGIPLELERVVRKAMAKSPENRYQHVEDLLVDLRAVGRDLEARTVTLTAGVAQSTGITSGNGKRSRLLAVAAVVVVAALAGLVWNTNRTRRPDSAPTGEPAAATEGRPSIAVLPFMDMSPERDQEYFCDGMAEELINAFTKLGGLKVSARTSSFQYKGEGHDVRQIGNDLGVETVLEGSVRKAGPRLRITAQLISVADGSHLWSETFDRNLDDVFAIQDEISHAIVERLRPELLGDESAELLGKTTANVEAYNLYLRGRWFWNKRTPPDLTQGIEYFERAIEVAPDYALAYAGMADCYTALAEYSVSPPEGIAARAKNAALRALEIDDTLAEAHAALGYIKMVYDWDWKGAEADFSRAIELNPQFAPAHHRYAVLLGTMGRSDEGLKEIRLAKKLEPHSVSISMTMGLLLCDVGLLDSAIEELERALEMDPDSYMAELALGVAYMNAERFDEAYAAFQEQNRLLGGRSPHAAVMIGINQAFSGNVDGAESTLSDLEELSKHQPVSSSLIAILCLKLGKKNEGFEWLERAYEERDHILREVLPVLQRGDVAGGDPRLDDLLAKMRLGS